MYGFLTKRKNMRTANLIKEKSILKIEKEMVSSLSLHRHHSGPSLVCPCPPTPGSSWDGVNPVSGGSLLRQSFSAGRLDLCPGQ